MHNRKPIAIGAVFGDYTVVGPSRTEGVQSRSEYLCQCSCGVTKYVNAYSLRSGRSKSCGCQRDMQTRARSTTHGMSKSSVYAVWLQARARCHDPRHRQYKDYGGRGISMCVRWRNSFEAFYADMGNPPFKGATLERKNNHRGYSPKNCTWATRTEQVRNRRNTRRFRFQGRSMLLVDWAKCLGIKKSTLVSRIYLYGWSVSKAFTTPVSR